MSNSMSRPAVDSDVVECALYLGKMKPSHVCRCRWRWCGASCVVAVMCGCALTWPSDVGGTDVWIASLRGGVLDGGVACVGERGGKVFPVWAAPRCCSCEIRIVSGKSSSGSSHLRPSPCWRHRRCPGALLVVRHSLGERSFCCPASSRYVAVSRPVLVCV